MPTLNDADFGFEAASPANSDAEHPGNIQLDSDFDSPSPMQARKQTYNRRLSKGRSLSQVLNEAAKEKDRAQKHTDEEEDSDDEEGCPSDAEEYVEGTTQNGAPRKRAEKQLPRFEDLHLGSSKSFADALKLVQEQGRQEGGFEYTFSGKFCVTFHQLFPLQPCDMSFLLKA